MDTDSCAYCFASCKQEASAGNPVGPQSDGYEDAQGPRVKADERSEEPRSGCLDMGEGHRSKLTAADSMGHARATFNQCGTCGRDVSSCTCDFGV